MDEFHFELAAKVEEAERNRGIDEARRAQTALETPPPGFHGECECGEPVPVARVNAGYYNCIDCARSTEYEARMMKQFKNLD